MSMSLEFEPHSWYMDFAIKHDPDHNDPCEFNYPYTDGKHCIVHDCKAAVTDNHCEAYAPKWEALTDDGNTYRIITRQSITLANLKSQIRAYRNNYYQGSK